MTLRDALSARVFAAVHGRHLVYNTCWEDPRLDRAALDLQADDTVVMITSAGCNALDYALLGPRRIHTVDLNPRQNALLELKQAGIRALDYDSFFAMFGCGVWPGCREAYRRTLRDQLSDSARGYWDDRIGTFEGSRHWPSFYFHGTAGAVARAMGLYIDRVARVRDSIDAILRATSLDEQREIYEERIGPAFWTSPVRWLMGRDGLLALLGVPREQRRQVERDHAGGIARFVEQAVGAVFTRLPIADNYFWRVYLTGSYTPECCPEYLKRTGFERLRAGLVDRISTHTCSVQEFLERPGEPVSRYVLLDHMDWMASTDPVALAREWQALVDRATTGARILWRSGGFRTDFVDDLRVRIGGRAARVGDVLRYHRDLAERLHQTDRVHTYGSFHIADLAAA